MTTEQLENAENIARGIIQQKQAVHAKVTALSVAKEIQGLRAIFDEVYPDPVRVISIGNTLEELQNDPQAGYKTSVEFCGGT